MAWEKKTQLSLIQLELNDDVFQMGEDMNSPFSGCSYSPQSRRSSDASSMSSAAEAATPSSATGSVATPDDLFGLKGLYYFPAIASEIGRLFFPAAAAVSVAAETNTQQLKSVWDDFDQNGTNTTLDNLDRLQRGMLSSEPESPSRRNRTLSGADRTLSTAEETFQDIVTKAKLIDILRERETVQRANRSMTRMSSTPKSGAKTKSAIRSCVFCRNNGEAESISSSHSLKDPEGNVTCPILYIYTCPICGASGKDAHTIKYCPYSTGETPSPSVVRSGASRPPSMRPNSFF